MLNQVLALAHVAGQEIMKIYNAADHGTVYKDDHSPLTAADLAAHHAIVAGLTEMAPDLPVLSEESNAISVAERLSWSRYWLVDPLDGTKEFINRNGEFTVNIALIEHGKPVLGVVHAPALGLSYFAEVGGRACSLATGQLPRKIRVSPNYAKPPLKIVGSRSHADEKQESLLTYLGDTVFCSLGSSLKLCMVADGHAHFYPRLGPTMEWDTAAAHCVVNVAGGRVCDFSGEELVYNKESLLNPPFCVLAAANVELLDRIRAWQ